MKAIAAMDPYRVIGSKGRIPWHYSEDLKWFKDFTWGKTLVMGRKTFDSLPVLKNRDVVVVTTIENVTCYHSNNWEKCRNLYLRSPIAGHVNEFNPAEWPDAIVAGGAKVYETLLPFCDELYMTHIAEDFDGDIFMPPFEHLFPNSAIHWEGRDFSIVRYWK